MIELYNTICGFIVAFFNKTGLMIGKTTDMPLDAIIVTSARTELWRRKELVEISIETQKISAIEKGLDAYLKSAECKKTVAKEVKIYFDKA